MSFELVVGSGIISFLSLYLFATLYNANRTVLNKDKIGVVVLMLGLLLLSLVGLYGVSRGVVDSDYQCEWLLQEKLTNGNKVEKTWAYTCLDEPRTGTSLSIYRTVMLFISLVSLFVILTMLYLLKDILKLVVNNIKRK